MALAAYGPSAGFPIAMLLAIVFGISGFSAWMQGEPLDIQRLLYTPEGKPRLSILSIAHLSDAERMFVTIFGPDLENDAVESGLYLPLKDEEGVLGVLVFESHSVDFATPTQREVAASLACRCSSRSHRRDSRRPARGAW